MLWTGTFWGLMMEKSIIHAYFLASKLGPISVTTLIVTIRHTDQNKTQSFSTGLSLHCGNVCVWYSVNSTGTIGLTFSNTINLYQYITYYNTFWTHIRVNAFKNNATDPTEKILSNLMVIRNLTVTAVPQIKQCAPSLAADWSSGDRCAASRQAKTSDHGATHTDFQETCCCMKES